MRVWIVLVLAAVLPLLAACQGAGATPDVSTAILRPPAEEGVAEAALRHAMEESDRADRGVFAAYVLPRTEESGRLAERLRDIAPLVTDCLAVSMEGGLARARNSDALVKLWMVRVMALSPAAEDGVGRATAEVSWTMGLPGFGESRLSVLTLETRDGRWVVTGEKMERLFDEAGGSGIHVAEHAAPAAGEIPPAKGESAEDALLSREERAGDP